MKVLMHFNENSFVSFPLAFVSKSKKIIRHDKGRKNLQKFEFASLARTLPD